MFLSILIFLTVILLYINLLHQWKRNDNLEVFEIDYVESSAHLQDACDLRQPLVFRADFLPSIAISSFAARSLTVGVKDTRDYVSGNIDAVDITLERARRFMDSAPRHYFSEGNSMFLRDSGVLRTFQPQADDWFKPPVYTVASHYDMLLGAAQTPFRYHTDYRRFYWVAAGTLTVHLTPPSGLIGSQTVKDYEFYEFYSRSSTSHRNPATTIDVTVQQGHVLYVPPYWWHSLSFEDTSSLVIQLSYMTCMNAVANAKDLVLCWLQQRNIHYKHPNKITQECISPDENADSSASQQFETPPCVVDAGDNEKTIQQHDSPEEPPPSVVVPETMREDVHRADLAEHVASRENLSLEHEILQSTQGDG